MEQPINPPELKEVDFDAAEQVAFDRKRCQKEVEDTSVNISRGCIYAPRFEYRSGDPTWVRHFCFDQQKRNLLALVRPDIETLDHLLADEQALKIAEAIDTHMHREMREMLRMEPTSFMRWFETEDTDVWEMAQTFPNGYLQLMWLAGEAVYERFQGLLPINFR